VSTYYLHYKRLTIMSNDYNSIIWYKRSLDIFYQYKYLVYAISFKSWYTYTATQIKVQFKKVFYTDTSKSKLYLLIKIQKKLSIVMMKQKVCLFFIIQYFRSLSNIGSTKGDLGNLSPPSNLFDYLRFNNYLSKDSESSEIHPMQYDVENYCNKIIQK